MKSTKRKKPLDDPDFEDVAHRLASPRQQFDTHYQAHTRTKCTMKNCELTIDRDVNAARSIFFKNEYKLTWARRVRAPGDAYSEVVRPFKKTLGALASIASSTACADASNSSSNGVSAAIRPFDDIVEERIEGLIARGTRVTDNTMLHEVDDAVLAFVIDRVKILFEDAEYIDEMDTMMKDRLHLHAEMIKNQSEKAAAVQQSMSAAKASLTKLQAKMDRALAVQQNLRKRAAAVLQAVKENQPNLSRAEREFKIELEQMAVEVRRMKPRVAQLTVSGQRMVRSLENAALSASTSSLSPSSRYRAILSGSSVGGGAGQLSDEKKKMCFDVLRAETQLIDDTKALIEDMTANLQHLKA